MDNSIKKCPFCGTENISPDPRECCSEQIVKPSSVRPRQTTASKVENFFKVNTNELVIFFAMFFIFSFIFFAWQAKAFSKIMLPLNIGSRAPIFSCVINDEILKKYIDCDSKSNQINLLDQAGNVLLALDKKKLILSCSENDQSGRCEKEISLKNDFVVKNNLPKENKTIYLLLSGDATKIKNAAEEIFLAADLQYGDLIKIKNNKSEMNLKYNNFYRIKITINNNPKDINKLALFGLKVDVASTEVGATKAIYDFKSFQNELENYLADPKNNNLNAPSSFASHVKYLSDNLESANNKIILVLDDNVSFSVLSHNYSLDEKSCERWHDLAARHNVSEDQKYKECVKKNEGSCPRPDFRSTDYSDYYFAKIKNILYPLKFLDKNIEFKIINLREDTSSCQEENDRVIGRVEKYF
jgi:hypothetical protein